MTGQEKNERSRVLGWSPSAAARLKDAVKKCGSQAAVAELAQISRPSLVEILSGRAVPTNATLERLCDAIHVDRADILAEPAARKEQEPISFIPLHDVLVSAGSGVNAVEAGETLESLGFPTAWLRNRFGDPAKLRVVHVKGDSMAPTLSDGDMVMISIDRRDPVDGVFVLRIYDQLMVKRVHFPTPRRVLVTSDNRDYDRWDRMIDLESEVERENFNLIGRVVWAGLSF